MRIPSMCTAILSFFLGAALAVVPVRIASAQEVRVNAETKAIAHYIMGSMADLYGLSVQAVGEYKQAVGYDPASYLPYLRLGTGLARLGNFDEAVEYLTKIPAINPQDIQSHYLLALIYSSQKKFDRAAAEYEVILKSLTTKTPDNADLYYYLGQLYYARRDYEKAIDQFNKILLIQPENSEMMYFLGSLYVEVHRDDEAIKIFKKALEIDPNHDGVLNSLGFIYAEQGNNLDEAMKLVNRAIAVDPDSAAYLDSLGWVYFKQGRYDEALKTLLKADGIAHDPVIYEHIGDVYLALKNPGQAKEFWKKSISLDPDNKAVLDKIERLEKKQTSPAPQTPKNDNISEGVR